MENFFVIVFSVDEVYLMNKLISLSIFCRHKEMGFDMDSQSWMQGEHYLVAFFSKGSLPRDFVCNFAPMKG